MMVPIADSYNEEPYVSVPTLANAFCALTVATAVPHLVTVG